MREVMFTLDSLINIHKKHWCDENVKSSSSKRNGFLQRFLQNFTNKLSVPRTETETAFFRKEAFTSGKTFQGWKIVRHISITSIFDCPTARRTGENLMMVIIATVEWHPTQQLMIGATYNLRMMWIIERALPLCISVDSTKPGKFGQTKSLLTLHKTLSFWNCSKRAHKVLFSANSFTGTRRREKRFYF